MSQMAAQLPLVSDISDQVRDFYDHYPYPRPVDDLENYQRLWQDRQRRRADHHLFWPDRTYSEDRSVLVAGCGTSQAAKHALRWPAAQVTGIDASATSVRYTNRGRRLLSKSNTHNPGYKNRDKKRGVGGTPPCVRTKTASL